MGAPGCGKGTQGERLSKELGVPHVSSGDLIREIVLGGSEEAARFKDLISSGNFIPSSDVVRIIARRLAEGDARDGYLLDGFPRTLDQASLFADTPFGAGLQRVVALSIAEEALVERLGGRLTCLNCGATYHETYRRPRKAGVCDVCGHELTKRSDDQPAAIRQRLKVYHQKTEPLISYYQERNLYSEIDASGTPEQVYERLRHSLGLE